jgi:hypothetical protein
MIPMTKERQVGTWSGSVHSELLHQLFAANDANQTEGADPERGNDTEYLRSVRDSNDAFAFCNYSNFYGHYRKEATKFMNNKMKTGQPRNTGGAAIAAAGCASVAFGGGGDSGSRMVKKRRADIDTISKWQARCLTVFQSLY